MGWTSQNIFPKWIDKEILCFISKHQLNDKELVKWNKQRVDTIDIDTANPGGNREHVLSRSKLSIGTGRLLLQSSVSSLFKILTLVCFSHECFLSMLVFRKCQFFTQSLYVGVCVHVRLCYSQPKKGRVYTSQELHTALFCQEQELPVKATTLWSEARHNYAAMFLTLGAPIRRPKNKAHEFHTQD